jgi:hypothetical protein
LTGLTSQLLAIVNRPFLSSEAGSERSAETSSARTLVESDPAGGYIVTLLSTTGLPDKQSLKAHGLAWRLFTASEVLLGAVIVIGHNVYHVLPNEVPILFGQEGKFPSETAARRS